MTRRGRGSFALLALLALGGGATAGDDAGSQTVEIHPDDTVFAVVTHKAGLASGLAHDHLVTATDPTVELVFDPAAPLDARFELAVAVGSLAFDRPAEQERWSPRLVELGVLDEPPAEISAKDREKIRSSALDEGQLHAEKFPSLSARLVATEKDEAAVGGVSFPYTATVALTVRGKTVEVPVAARYQVTDGEITIEAVGTFRFTDVGIEPYSAFFGAVKNQDRVHLFLHLRGTLPPG